MAKCCTVDGTVPDYGPGLKLKAMPLTGPGDKDAVIESGHYITVEVGTNLQSLY